MLTRVILVLVALVVAISSTSAANSELDGWDKAKFGMSIDEVLAAYPSAKLTKLWSLEKNSFEKGVERIVLVSGGEILNTFFFGDSGLDYIRFLDRNKKVYGEACIGRFDHIFSAAREKFGDPDLGPQPTSLKSSEGMKATWMFTNGAAARVYSEIYHVTESVKLCITKSEYFLSKDSIYQVNRHFRGSNDQPVSDIIGPSGRIESYIN